MNLKSGRTVTFDLEKETDAAEWKRSVADVSFQSSIRAIGIVTGGFYFTLPLPKKFRLMHFDAELVQSTKLDRKYVGERVKCFCDDLLISILVYYGTMPKMSRVDILKIGRRRFNPELNTG